MRKIRLASLLALTLIFRGVDAVAAIDPPAFRRDLDALVSPPSRVVGSDGYYRTVHYLEQQIQTLPNVELRKHEFPVIVPITHSATLTLPDGSVEPIYPFWPASVRVNSTPPEGITARAVYCGKGAAAEIPPASVKGQIAVVEASAAERWQRAAYFGACAIVVLGSADTTHVDLRSHDLPIPLSIPRFFVPPGKLCDRLREGSFSQALTLRASVRWERKSAVNLYALVRPRIDSGNSAALMISVPLDSSGLVPDLARGASQAVQTAAALALLRDFSRQPLDRPIVLCFSGADSINFLGTRNMLLALSESGARWDEELDRLALLRRECEIEYRRASALRESPEKLDVRRDQKLLARISTIIEAEAVEEQDRLFRLRIKPRDQKNPREQREEDALQSRQVALSRLRYMFLQNPSGLNLQDAKIFLVRTIDHLAELSDQFEARQDELIARQSLYRWLASAVGRNENPGREENNQRPIELLIALDLSDRGMRCGPMFFGQYQRAANVTDIQDYRDWFARTADEQPAWFAQISRAIDFEPFSQSRSPASFLAGPLPIGTEMAPAWGVPAFSIITLDDIRLWRDTPNDTLDRIRLDPILGQLDAIQSLISHAWNDPTFKGPVERRRQRADITGQVVSIAPGRPVPDLPREGFLATYFHVVSLPKKIPQLRSMPWTLGIRRCEIRDCDADGSYRFEGIPRIVPDPAKDSYLAVEVFRIDDSSGAITAATDLGRQVGDISLYADLRTDPLPLRSLAFNCEEFSLTGLYDPRHLQSLAEIIPLDARRNAEPQRYNLMLHDQLLAGFIEPDSRANLIFRYGRVGNRLLLLNIPPDQPASTGFTALQLREIGPLALATSRDLWRLDDVRLKEYRTAGVSNNLLDSMHNDSGAMLSRAEDFLKADRGEAMEREATGAWANEARVYAATDDMARDVVRAAIFLLLLCVPFAFVMERLLFAFPSIYRQITGAAFIFAIMTVALWAFHPAFQISSSPLIIILAFAIIFMSTVVIVVIYGKFDAELKQIRAGRGRSQAASFARMSVFMSAVLLGLANMRRRKFRTALTSLTIILMTFTLLCFTSATRYLDSTNIPAGVAPSHHGIMLRQRGFRPIAPIAPESAAAVVESVVGRPVNIVQRWWNLLERDPDEKVNLVAGARAVAAVSAVLGLSPGESELSKIAEVIGREKFARLENREFGIIYISSITARQLAVDEGDKLNIAGIELEVAGIYDAVEFDRNVSMLSGEPLAPLEYSKGALDAGRRKLEESAADSLQLDAASAAAEISGTYRHLSSSQFVIVPAAVSKMLHNATLRSIGFRLHDQPEIKKVSDELARRYSLALFAGFDDGVRMVTASNLARVSGAGQVAVPLVIASLIIFNTMLGSIAERRNEIHIYTSLGLAPLHVGALFLAEALTYGVIGGVFGYIIGQGAATVLLKSGWLGDVTLNYSGTSAMLTIALILVIVLISALIPARLASKLAAPSIERTWKVPPPLDGIIRAQLPFTITKTAADGALAYLAEFFQAHREGSIGKFSAGPVVFFSAGTSRGLRSDIWLTPFDLGVRQHFELLIHPGAFHDIYEVEVILRQQSGDDASWRRMNKSFLTELRKQFLQWRSLTPQRMLEYVQRSVRIDSSERSE